jgi:glycine C-acetyltransferase
MANTKAFREGVEKAGFDIKQGTHPIVPVMIGDAKLATALADALLEEGIYVIGFSYPVVPQGQARVRVQLSAAHSPEDVDKAVDALARVGKKLGIV